MPPTVLTKRNMRRNNLTMAIIVMLMPLFWACSSDSSSDSTSSDEVVVEGWIASGEFPVVVVSSTLALTEREQEVSAITDHVDHWARVTVSDGDREVVLMGKSDSRYMPPFIYTTTDMRGETGKTYRLTIETKDRRATAVTTIPEAVPLDSVDEELHDNLPLGRRLYAVFNNPGGTRFYGLFYIVGQNSQQPTLSTMGVFDNTMINEGAVRYPINISDNLVEDRKSSIFEVRPQYIGIRLVTFDKESYDFWRDYQDIYTMSGNFFMPFTTGIRGNVTGAYGYWSGMGLSERWITLR